MSGSFEKRIIGDCTLYCGDCRKILPTFSTIPAVVSDPPYGIAYVKGHGGKGRWSRRNCAPIHGDNEPFDPSLWLVFPEVILWGADHYAQRLPHGRWLVWDKLDGVESFDSFSDVEIAWHNVRGASRIFRHMWKGVCQASERMTERYHPTQKPVALMEWCLGFIKADTIFDPYMGSGTTAIACIKTGKKFIGIDIELRYFEIACRRIEDAYRQGDLFVARPA